MRVVALALIAIWTAYRIEPPTLYHYLLLIGLLAAIGYLQVPFGRLRGAVGWTLRGAAILLEMAVLAYALVVPPPGAPPEWSMAMQFRLGSFDYVYLFIALTALTYNPAAAVWTAFAAILVWSVAAVAALRPEAVYTILDLHRFQTMDGATLRATLLDPNYLSAVERMQEGLLALVLAAIVALAVARSRALVAREIRVSAERTNLARYFSPDLVAGLAARSSLGQPVERAEAAILFADLVGFTPFAERRSPEAVIGVLRQFHSRMAAAVFRHHGTLHKFLGDGLMASFGATSFGAAGRGAPAAQALDGLGAVLEAMREWNAERAATGDEPLRLALGLHVGPVVTGDIGDERCLEFAVLGDTVNVASRLEELCRPLDAAAVISRTVAEAAPAHPLLEAFQPIAGGTRIRGRDAALELLRLPLEDMPPGRRAAVPD